MEISYETLKKFETHFDQRYVLQNDCSSVQQKNNNHFSNDDKRIEIIKHDFGVIKRLMWTVATSSIGALVATVFEVISK